MDASRERDDGRAPGSIDAPSAGTGAPAPSSPRLAALDWMRGLVMVLMAIDHASQDFNARRRAAMADSVWMAPRGSPLPDAADFLTRWITHLCAPSFLFLAGTGLALSLARRRRAGESEWAIDRDLLIRGLVIVSGDVFLVSALHGFGTFLQVLYAIGASFVLMIPLRRLPAGVLVGLGLAILAGTEAVLDSMGLIGDWSPPWWIGATLSPAGLDRVLILYPVLPWLAMLLLGFGLGVRLSRTARVPGGLARARWLLFTAGIAALALFAVVRQRNGYGNMGHLRPDDSWIAWLRVSKYPPSLTFAALELGIMALLVAAIMRIESSLARPLSRWNPLPVFGRTPFFFYVLHLPILKFTSQWLDLHEQGGLIETYLAAAGICAVLYVPCLLYGRHKAAHPGGWTRFL